MRMLLRCCYVVVSLRILVPVSSYATSNRLNARSCVGRAKRNATQQSQSIVRILCILRILYVEIDSGHSDSYSTVFAWQPYVLLTDTNRYVLPYILRTFLLNASTEMQVQRLTGKHKFNSTPYSAVEGMAVVAAVASGTQCGFLDDRGCFD
jgi:hypothetical protein